MNTFCKLCCQTRTKRLEKAKNSFCKNVPWNIVLHSSKGPDSSLSQKRSKSLYPNVYIQDTVTCIPGAAAGSVATLPCMKYYGEKEFDTSRKYILAFSYGYKALIKLLYKCVIFLVR